MLAGAHFLTHCDWGCPGGDHRLWITIEAENDADARRMVPTVVRQRARVILLIKVTPEHLQDMKNVGTFFADGSPPVDIPMSEHFP